MDKETETTINRLLADNKAAYDLNGYLAKENKRLRNRLENPTEKMLEAGRAANRLVAGNALGLACIAPDSAWSAMANLILTEDW
jgi:hypothetical protein